MVGIRVHPARTATGEFIRHMNAAVETVQGQPLNLHMFSFDAELDNVTKQNKGGDWKDREILELKAFHNEQDGQMYANQESVTGMFNVFWNFIYTGFRKLPDEFKTQQFIDVFGCSQQAASRAIIRFQEDGMVEKVKYGLYKKVVSELP